MPLLWRVFATNAAILTAATLLLAISPATVSFPIALTEGVVLAAGLATMLLIDLALLRRAFAPLRRLTTTMQAVDPLRPGARALLDASDPDVAELTQAFNEMLDRVEFERRDSGRRALAAQEHERRRIARELHDEVGQALTAVVLQLDRLRGLVDAPRQRELEETREAVRSSLEDVRGIARRLRPEVLDDLGLTSALAALTNDVERVTGTRVERRLSREIRELTPEEEVVVYRVAQEALTNVGRHARAGRAWLALRADDAGVELEIRDDGAGFDMNSTTEGAGLRGMLERAVLIGAVLEVRSTLGSGTTVRLRLPT